MSRNPGDGPAGPPEAPDPLDADFASLVPLFVAESQERLAAMELSLLTLEKEPGNRAALDEVFRGAHTIKGDAATLGMRDLADFAHRVEDTLDQLRDGTRKMSSALATALLRTVDVLRELVAEAEGAEERSREELDQILASISEQLSESAPSTAERGAASAPALAIDQGAGSLRVEVTRLDDLLTLAGELVAARSQLIAALEGNEPRSELLELTRSTERLYLDLQDLVMKLRMVAVGPSFRRLQRMVRDQALALEKQATLELEGTDVELDNSVLQRLRDPLSHLLRNALAHGIETPAERAAIGKPETGRIVLRSRRDGGAISIEVADDGRGLDRDAIIEQARLLGLIGAEDIGHAEALDLVFLPGLSTARQVSEAAGRGVGLDVVKREVESLRGTVRVASRLGEGTTVAISLPLTLAVIEALHVTVGGQLFVISLDVVHEVLELPEGTMAADQATDILELRDHSVTCVRLDALLGLDPPPGGPVQHQRIVVLHLAVGEVGVVVDEVLGKSQTLIRPLPRMLRRTPGFSGLAALSDGRLALILDVPDLLRYHRLTAATEASALAAGGDE